MELPKLPISLIESFTENANLIAVNDTKLAAIVNNDLALDADKSELLRHLAIELECEFFLEGWSGLRRIYAAAENADPSNVDVLISWAVSAGIWYEESRTTNLQERVWIASDAEQALARAEKITPDDAYIFYARGRLYYNHPLRHNALSQWKQKALTCFEQATSLKPDFQMAWLYQAYCYHDLRIWQLAYDCYLAVDGAALLLEHPNWLWRRLKRDEQLALCTAKISRIQEAAERIEILFDEIDVMDTEQTTFDVVNLDEAVELLCQHIYDSELSSKLILLIEKLNLGNRYAEELLTLRARINAA